MLIIRMTFTSTTDALKTIFWPATQPLKMLGEGMLEKNKNQVNTGLMQQIFILLYNCAFYALFRSGSGILHELTKR